MITAAMICLLARCLFEEGSDLVRPTEELSEIQETLPKGTRNAVEPNGGRGSRRSLASSAPEPATKKFKRPIVVDDDDDDEDEDRGQRQVDIDEQDEDSEEERRQSKLDKQAGKKVKQFANLMKAGQS